MEEVCDPEIPVLSIIDLGIVREVHLNSLSFREPARAGTDGGWGGAVLITPTYSGCPAMDAIAMDIRLKLLEHGFKNIKIIHVLSPAWTTDWMSEAGKQKLNDYGIAPPHLSNDKNKIVECPQCHSSNTKLLSQFGSTACKALYQCQDCKEPFDYFKCH